jgi:hypothetical protein
LAAAFATYFTVRSHPAGAATVDRGWTQLFNSWGGPPPTGNINCYPSCASMPQPPWQSPPGGTYNVPYDFNWQYMPAILTTSIPRAAEINWNQYRDTAAWPYIYRQAGTTAANGIYYNMYNYAPKVFCAQTDHTKGSGSPDGGRNQITIIGGNITANSSQNFNAGQGCGNVEAMWTHETGHVMGLGHTQHTGNLMYFTLQAGVVTPSFNDRHGMECIYGRFNCTVGP